MNVKFKIDVQKLTLKHALMKIEWFNPIVRKRLQTFHEFLDWRNIAKLLAFSPLLIFCLGTIQIIRVMFAKSAKMNYTSTKMIISRHVWRSMFSCSNSAITLHMQKFMFIWHKTVVSCKANSKLDLNKTAIMSMQNKICAWNLVVACNPFFCMFVE